MSHKVDDTKHTQVGYQYISIMKEDLTWISSNQFFFFFIFGSLKSHPFHDLSRTKIELKLVTQPHFILHESIIGLKIRLHTKISFLWLKSSPCGVAKDLSCWAVPINADHKHG